MPNKSKKKSRKTSSTPQKPKVEEPQNKGPIILAFNDETIASRICGYVRVVDMLLPHRWLYYMALTCKALHGPAIKEIWRNLDTLVPLVYLLPAACWQMGMVSPEMTASLKKRKKPVISSVWGTVEREERDRPLEDVIKMHLKVTRRLNKSDCRRVIYYASLVKSFTSIWSHYGRIKHIFVDQNAYQLIFNALKSEYNSDTLFPNLEALEWTVHDESVFPLFATMLTPGLRSFVVSVDGNQKNRLKHISAKLAYSCPQLRVVHVQNCVDLGGLAEFSVQTTEFKHLEELEIDTVSTEAYLRLANNLSLRTLTIKNVDAVDWKIAAAQLATPSFHLLGDLSIGSSRMDNCIEMLKATQHSPLKSLHVQLQGCQLGEDWGRLTCTIQAHCSFDHLEIIHLSDRANKGESLEEGPSTESPFSSEDLEPLFSFKNITSLACHIACTIELDDDCIRAATESFPKLESFSILSLQQSRPTFDSPRVGIDTLAHFAQNCPELHYLGLAFDARFPEASESLCRNPSIRSKMEFLFVGNSVLMSPHRVAGMFSDWFPRLRMIRMGPPGALDVVHPYDERLKKEWQEVPKLIKYMMRVRMQERKTLKRWKEKNGDVGSDKLKGLVSIG
ncbi:hypothetical protein BDN72DRAFT_961552 [Pluteus cervinus]|uniref:Uncharacterized protein n=1 Tax=Pluteus cervinus TaxID=181527 RepID=A0ACD3ALX3_9AGAR|nr:hypothetical protein BDN72DRAFT_961552 [Pluteus cervinus]